MHAAGLEGSPGPRAQFGAPPCAHSLGPEPGGALRRQEPTSWRRRREVACGPRGCRKQRPWCPRTHSATSCCVTFSRAPSRAESQWPIWEMGMLTRALTSSHVDSIYKSHSTALMLLGTGGDQVRPGRDGPASLGGPGFGGPPGPGLGATAGPCSSRTVSRTLLPSGFTLFF